MTSAAKIGSFTNRGQSKVERYKWTLVDEPGVFEEIGKEDLITDPIYQRISTERKVLRMAREWSWVACGCLIVAIRDDKYYVIDGGHRVTAARLRSDISRMPCIVFDTESIEEEAKGFLNSNTNRVAMTFIQRFTAQLIAKDEVALKVRDLLEEYGYTISHHVELGSETKGIKCIGMLSMLVKDHEKVLRRMFPIIVDVCHNGPISERILYSIVMVEEKLNKKDISIANQPWRSRLVKLGQDEILESIVKAQAFYKKGGKISWTTGLLGALNRGVRHRLTIDDGSDLATDE